MTERSPISSINRVLEAEAKSKDSLEKCRQRALDIIEDGRNQARRINLRADERITAIHAKADLSVDRKLAELKHQITSLSSDVVFDENERSRLQASIADLVEEMIGDSP